MKKVLVIAAHPDDELLGCGGTIKKHTNQGDEVTSVIVCEGESLRYHRTVGQSEAMKQAANLLGLKEVKLIGYPDQKLDTMSLTDIIKPLEAISEQIKPDIVYCQFGGDINLDHQLVFQAANVTFRPVNTWVKEFYAFYTVSSTEWAFPQSFFPDTWIDISATLNEKLQAFQCYTSEVRNYPHPRSVEALKNVAMFYGNQCCMKAAEPFVTIRRVVR